MIALDDNIEDHPKFVSLSDDSFSLWIRCIGYCRRNLTDGFVPEEAARKRCRGRRRARDVIGELTAPPVGKPDSEPLWGPVPGGYQVHDYLEWNPSRDEVEAKRESKRVAGRTGGKQSGVVRASPESKQTRSKNEPNANQTRSKTEAPCFDSASLLANPDPDPDPIRSDPDPDPISDNSELLSPPGGRTGPQHQQPRSVGPEAPLEVTPEIRVVWQALKAHEVLQPIATMRLASGIVGFAMSAGKAIDLVVTAIGEAAFDAAEAGLTAEALTRKVRSYVRNARPPRETGDQAAATPPTRDELPARYRNPPPKEPDAPQTAQSLREGIAAIRATGIEPHPAMLVTLRQLEAEEVSRAEQAS